MLGHNGTQPEFGIGLTDGAEGGTIVWLNYDFAKVTGGSRDDMKAHMERTAAQVPTCVHSWWQGGTKCEHPGGSAFSVARVAREASVAGGGEYGKWW